VHRVPPSSGRTARWQLHIRTIHYWKGSLMGNQYYIRIARAGTFQDTAGVYLYKSGPTPEKDLFAAVGVTLAPHLQAEVLQRAIRWLAVG
jgi:hypothetical protein